MGKRFKDVVFGDEIYVMSVFVVFNGRGDNSDNELMKKIEGIYTMLSRFHNKSYIWRVYQNLFYVIRKFKENL